ncbi:hypothetical protein FRB95_010875 [Tulasnella sp. JGI-2019a]|nr:hypothetical protein FRB93_008411 [Tulasnella sp. JGI-2019a]KAG9024924.1 hypothetical protein FRB95_010875 [Tulasnella sp. JGI-2019a]
MLLQTVVLVVAAFHRFVHAGWINAREPLPSPTATQCTASCPRTDGIGSHLSTTVELDGLMHCTYPQFAGDVSHYCIYAPLIGVQVLDADGGECPRSAPLPCAHPVGPAPHKRESVPAKPQPAAVPINMRSFAALKQSKLKARTGKEKPSKKETKVVQSLYHNRRL